MRWIRVGAVVALLAFAVSGCGGSNDAGGDTTNAAAIDTTAITVADTTEADTTMTDTSEADTTSSTAGLSGACKDLAEASSTFADAAGSATGVDGNLDETEKAFDAIVARAPDELKDDFEALADVISEYAKALKDLDLKPGEAPSAAQIAELVQVGQAFATEKVQKATTAIQAWVTANCTTTP